MTWEVANLFFCLFFPHIRTGINKDYAFHSHMTVWVVCTYSSFFPCFTQKMLKMNMSIYWTNHCPWGTVIFHVLNRMGESLAMNVLKIYILIWLTWLNNVIVSLQLVDDESLNLEMHENILHDTKWMLFLQIMLSTFSRFKNMWPFSLKSMTVQLMSAHNFWKLCFLKI